MTLSLNSSDGLNKTEITETGEQAIATFIPLDLNNTAPLGASVSRYFLQLLVFSFLLSRFETPPPSMATAPVMRSRGLF